MVTAQQEALTKVAQKNTLRSESMKKRYMHFLETNTKGNCIYCDKELLVKEFKYWMILENRFPYDGIAEISHMLAPKRHVPTEGDLDEKELIELADIKKNELHNYDVIIESTPRATTRPDHYHVHLLKYYTN